MRIPFHCVSSKARFGVALLQHGMGQDRNSDQTRSDESTGM